MPREGLASRGFCLERFFPREVFASRGFKQKTAYEIMSGDWSSDVCSSDLIWPDNPVKSDLRALNFLLPKPAKKPSLARLVSASLLK